MTFIQPNKNSSFLNAMFMLLIVALGAGIFGMVGLYNATVTASANIAHAKAELDLIGARSTEMQNRVIAALSGGELAKIAQADGLVTDTKPRYFPLGPLSANQVHPQWPIASHY